MAQQIKPTPRGQAIELPADTAKKYRFTQPLYGGPVFDFPAFGITGLNFATLTEQQAERLIRLKWRGIERVPTAENRAAATPEPSKASATRPSTKPEE